jgi:hypothetical protein
MTEDQQIPPIPYHERLRLIKLGQLPKEAVAKKKKPIPRQSERKKIEIAKEKEAGTDSALDLWFEARRLEMTGRCCLCGGKSEKNNDETYRRSIHHLFDKRQIMFPSVATNPENWLELCHFGNSCHDNIHNKTITWELLLDSSEGEMIVQKFRKIYPFMAEPERKNIPEILLKQL